MLGSADGGVQRKAWGQGAGREQHVPSLRWGTLTSWIAVSPQSARGRSLAHENWNCGAC